MLISHSHKFITIGIPKTGTRSLRAALCTKQQHSDGTSLNKIVDFIGLHGAKNLKQHAPICQCKEYMQKINCDINLYFIFTVVRNPWDRYVSYMFYNNQPLHEVIKDYPPQSHYIFDNNLLAVDYLAEFNRLQQEIDTLCNKVNIDRVSLPHLHKSIRKNYKEYYTHNLIELVREKEHKIIDLMGYTYD